jgi:hypothetical protein
MRVRLIHVSRSRAGIRGAREEILDVAEVNVGRGTDNEIRIGGLAVPLHHSAFVEQVEGARLEAREGVTLVVNGRATTAATVRPGDVISLGTTEIRVVEPRGDERLAVEVEQVGTAHCEAESLRQRTRIGIERGLLSRRPLTWALLALVLGAFLALPLLGPWNRTRAERDTGGRSASSDDAVGGSADRLRAERNVDAPTPPRGGLARLERMAWDSWDVGTISNPHRGIPCESCHDAPFSSVADEQCLACHGKVGKHAAEQVRLHQDAPGDCTACHSEHERDEGLLRVPDAKCISCHATLSAFATGATLEDVTDFGAGHPEFRASVLASLDASVPVRIRLSESPREQSGLAFPHDVHLKPGLRGPNSAETLECASCHEPRLGGLLMHRIRFAEQCERCHRLKFLNAPPNRTAPHAEPAEVRTALYEFFAAQALEDLPGSADAPPEGRRRPGARPAENARDDALAKARERSEAAALVLLGKDGRCDQCHAMSGEIADRRVADVRILPLRADDTWFPLARFDHSAHVDVPCDRCHPASKTSSAEIVMLPSIRTCRECHVGEERVAEKVNSPCVSCHLYHGPDPEVPVRQALRPANTGSPAP